MLESVQTFACEVVTEQWGWSYSYDDLEQYKHVPQSQNCFMYQSGHYFRAHHLLLVLFVEIIIFCDA